MEKGVYRMETELFKIVLQAGMGGIFFYLYWMTNKRLEAQHDKHDQDIAALYAQRINDLKIMAKIPTELDGSAPANPRVKNAI
jgi:hypothetical protein